MDCSIILERLELLCKSKGVSRNKALIDSGAGEGLAGNLQKGSAPSVEKIQNLADYFGVTVDYILGNSTEDKNNPPTDEEIKFALFNGADGITDEMYEEVKRFAEFVKEREKKKGT